MNTDFGNADFVFLYYFVLSYMLCVFLLLIPKFLCQQEQSEQDSVYEQLRGEHRPGHCLLLQDIGRILIGYHDRKIIVCIMQDHGNPDIVGLHVRPGEEDTQCDTGDDLRKRHDQPSVRGGVEEKVQENMPDAPGNSEEQNAAAHAEPFLQNGLQVIPPAVFLSEKGRKCEEKVDRHDEQVKPGGRVLYDLNDHVYLPLGKIEDGCPAKIQGQEKQDTQKRSLPLFPAKAVNRTSFPAGGQKRNPAQNRAADYDILAYHRPHGHGLIVQASRLHRQEYGEHCTQKHGDGQQCEAQEEPLRQHVVPPAGDHVSQHDAGSRIVHLGIGKCAQLRGYGAAVPGQQAHRISHTVSHKDKNKKLFFCV